MGVLPIIGRVRCYAWGKRNAESLVFRLADARERQPEKPHAELWLGTHRSAPAYVVHRGQGEKITSLAEIVALPYLLKILSIGKPLSIQLHPEQSLAEVLHRQDPAHYPDGQAKPEMVYALTRFTALHGFRSRRAIDEEAERFAVIGGLYPACANLSDKEAIRYWFERLSQLSANEVSDWCEKLIETYDCEGAVLDYRGSWFKRISANFTAVDRGLLFFPLLELKTLEAGQVLFTAPGVLHAYLEGDVVECMATSDNVIRIGLTDKFVDLAAARQALNYELSSAALRTTTLALEQASDFSFDSSELGLRIHLLVLDSPLSDFELPAIPTGAIFLCLQGKGEIGSKSSTNSKDVFPFVAGDAMFLSPNSGHYILNLEAGRGVLAYESQVLS